MDIQIIKAGITNCYVIKNESAILVDAGMPDEINKFSKGLKDLGVNPGEIMAIVITHCHWDHIGCAKKIKDMTGAKVIVQKNEKNILIKGKIVFTPGHSPGSISVVLDSGDAFVGDMAMNGLPLTTRPNLPIFAEDMTAVKNSWRKLIDKGVKKIYPAHGKPFPIEKLMNKVVL